MSQLVARSARFVRLTSIARWSRYEPRLRNWCEILVMRGYLHWHGDELDADTAQDIHRPGELPLAPVRRPISVKRPYIRPNYAMALRQPINVVYGLGRNIHGHFGPPPASQSDLPPPSQRLHH